MFLASNNPDVLFGAIYFAQNFRRFAAIPPPAEIKTQLD